MTLPHYGAVKIVAVTVGLAATAFYAMDPTFTVAIIGFAIASITPTIAGVFNVVLHIMDRRERKADKKAAEAQAVRDRLKAEADQKLLHDSIGKVTKTVETIEENTNNKLDKLLGERNAATTRADISEGRETARLLSRAEQKEDAKEKP